ncbi:MAG: ABC transporter permease [Gemmatimonadaceae bacterium]|nr:ABC transporter permease [Gemmatimonadaceae bacterium]
MRNLRLAARMLLKTPFVTAIAVLSLGLGIGANAAIFSMFDQILNTPLPVPAPKELVNFKTQEPMPGSNSCNTAGGCDEVFSYPMFRDLERQQTVFTGIAAHRAFGASLAVGNEPLTGGGTMVSGSYFPTLGINARLGRLLQPSDDSVIGANFVTVLSHDFWRSRFGSNTNVIGQSVTINGRTFTVVGVAPEGFKGTTLGEQPLVFIPISMRGQISRWNRFENRRDYWVYLFARRKPGVSLAQAQAALNNVWRPILHDVEAPLQEGMSEPTMVRFKARTVTLSEGKRGQSNVHREATTPLFMLFGVTGIVLLIACANIANLLLARGAGRATEMGVRLALGATRRHLIVQLLTESVLLALMGGVVSLIVAQWTLSSIRGMLSTDAAATLDLRIQPAVIVFAGAVAVITGLLFGLFPALHSTRSDLITAIRAGAGQIAGGRAAARFRSALVVVQIALSMALLVSAGLFLKSLVNVSRVDLGLDLDSFATFHVAPVRSAYDSARAAIYFQRAHEELRAIPGVTAVTEAQVPLLSGDNWGTDVLVQGYPRGPDIDNNSRLNAVGPGYFSALGVPMKAGREITDADIMGAQRVAVVNEAFAKKFKLGNDVVGKYMDDDTAGDSLRIQIVGLIPNIRYSDVKDSVPPVFYRAWRQAPRTGDLHFYVKSSLPPEQLLRSIPTVMKKIDPAVPIEELKTLPQVVRDNVFLDRMISILSAAFALLATLLAAVGLYGVLAYSVTQRTREIGVRMALGADGGRVRRLVLSQVGVLLAIGGAIGIGAALGLGRAARSLLYRLEGHDPSVFAICVVLLALIALGAGYLPARRAAQVDPMNALRYD